ncbi:hypothetical protein BUALT_Bualt02G0051500 [Buddleja alternifolia]|uniref:tRNA-intron lyase n=1 Tax=Buddleja alternifolia TaxID=168488 RepID=A0AAV6Y5J7_9LAMI|nr:hypothetical protein BUALT_Bualt02G0051500 [Buddleja alternifolia]
MKQERVFLFSMKQTMAPRWKGKAAEAKALADPMSKIISRLQSSLIESNSQGLLSGCSVLIAAHTDQTELFNQACFGRPIITTEKDKQWFQLSLEEAFYLCYVLKCIKILGENKCVKDDDELWHYMTSKRANFPIIFKAYSHLRMKNWVVRAGSQYGVDFVAYRHHPSLVHSEYAVLVFSDEDGNRNGRLRVWSDFQCTLRLCGSVVKTLLVLHVGENGNGAISPPCLERYSVEERIVIRWSPEQSRENQVMVQKESSHSFSSLIDHVDFLYEKGLVTAACNAKHDEILNLVISAVLRMVHIILNLMVLVALCETNDFICIIKLHFDLQNLV